MLRQSMQITCLVLMLCMLAACSSSSQPDKESTVDASMEPAAARQQPTVFDDQLKALDKAKAVEATLEDAKAATDKAIDEASGG
jgi:uncharacterized lipoprotein